jgi:hypothetical protein
MLWKQKGTRDNIRTGTLYEYAQWLFTTCSLMYIYENNIIQDIEIEIKSTK